MKKNALIASSQKYSAIAAKKMQEQEHWNPVFFLTSPSNKSFVERNFPKATTLNYIESVKGVIPENFNVKFHLDIIEEIDIDFTIALSLLDRNDSNSKTFLHKDRLLFCYERISFWASIINEFKIEVILFEEEPHQCSDYILYKVAQHLGVKTPMAVRTIADLGIIPTFKFEESNPKFIQLYHQNIALHQKTNKIDLAPQLMNYLNKLSGSYEKVLKEHLWDQVDTYKEVFEKDGSTLKLILKYLNKSINRVLNFQKFEIRSDQKEVNKSFANSKLSYFKYQYYRVRTIFKKQQLYRDYKSLAVFPKELNNYVLCALQYQPEKSTCPLGGKYNEQRLMIESLRASLPENIKILVKEHPSQFIYDYARYGEYFRDKSYYQSILNIPNVELLDMRTNIFDYIDNALFIASVTGTICWEAVNRKVPALCFGHSWMTGCEGIHVVNTTTQIKKSIEEILNTKQQINITHVHLFAKTIYDLNFSMAVGGSQQLKQKRVTDEENAQILKNAIKWLVA